VRFLPRTLRCTHLFFYFIAMLPLACALPLPLDQTPSADGRRRFSLPAVRPNGSSLGSAWPDKCQPKKMKRPVTWDHCSALPPRLQEASVTRESRMLR